MVMHLNWMHLIMLSFHYYKVYFITCLMKFLEVILLYMEAGSLRELIWLQPFYMLDIWKILEGRRNSANF